MIWELLLVLAPSASVAPFGTGLYLPAFAGGHHRGALAVAAALC